MSLEYKVGTTDKSIKVFIQDSSVTTGAGLAGLVYNTASLTAYYQINNGTPTAITLATLASATAAHSDGGFIAVDGTNMPGLYRLDLPDAVLATAGEVVVFLKGAANMVPTAKEFQIVTNVVSDAVGRLPAALVSGRMDCSVGAMANNTMTAAAAASDLGTEIATAVWANGTRVLTAGTNIALAKGTGITGFNDIAAADVWAAGTRTLSAGTNIVLAKGTGVTGFNDLDAAGIRSAVGMSSANMDTQLSTIDAVADGIKAKTDNLPSDPADQSLIIDATSAILSAVNTVDGVADGIAAAIGSAGAGLTAIPWNGAWDAEVQSECADALNEYDPPTKAEMDARTMATADYATAAALATVDNVVDGIKITTDKLDTAVELDGAVYRLTKNALEEAPTGYSSIIV